jgi:hypothetical protein
MSLHLKIHVWKTKGMLERWERGKKSDKRVEDRRVLERENGREKKKERCSGVYRRERRKITKLHPFIQAKIAIAKKAQNDVLIFGQNGLSE